MIPEEPEISREQAAILAFVLGHVEAADDIEIREFAFAGEFSELYRAAVLEIGVDDDGRALSVVVTLPMHSTGVFFAITAGRVSEVVRMLANLEDYERDMARSLQPLECVVADGAEQFKALFLLRTASHEGLSGIPDVATINGKEIRFALVIGLDEGEYATKVESGPNALLDRLEASGKDLLFFDAD